LCETYYYIVIKLHVANCHISYNRIKQATIEDAGSERGASPGNAAAADVDDAAQAP